MCFLIVGCPKKVDTEKERTRKRQYNYQRVKQRPFLRILQKQFLKGGIFMRSIKITQAVFLLLCVLVVVTEQLFSQEFSAAQKEVWKTIEASWTSDAERNVEEFLSYLHPDFVGWSYKQDLPRDKDSQSKWVRFYFKTEKVLIHEIQPVVIKIYDNVAIAHYCYSVVYKDAEDKQKSSKGRYTDILIKEGDKWLFIGWHGGERSEN